MFQALWEQKRKLICHNFDLSSSKISIMRKEEVSNECKDKTVSRRKASHFHRSLILSQAEGIDLLKKTNWDY